MPGPVVAMTWVKLTDTFAEEFEELGAEAMALHVAALGYCARLLSDGHIPARKARALFPIDNPDAVIKSLVDAGRWTVTEAGYVIANYHDDQPTADEVRRQRRRKAQNQANYVAKIRARRDASADRSADRPVTGSLIGPPPRPAPPRREGVRGGAAGTVGSPDGSPPSAALPSEYVVDGVDLSLYFDRDYYDRPGG